MGARGPLPTPTAILEARGSWRAGEREGEPRPPPGRPECPECLGPLARAEWERIGAQLEAMGLLAACDQAALAAYCDAWEEFASAAAACTRLLTGDPTLLLDPTFERLLRTKRQAAAQLVRLAGHFGLSPATRTRIKVTAPEEKKPDVRRRFFGDN